MVQGGVIMADRFDILYDFDGNLNNTQFEQAARTTVLSGTPSYNASPNGQALVTSSAKIKVETYYPVMWETGLEHGMAIKIATGVTDGVIMTADGYDTDQVSLLGRWALVINGGNLEMRRWNQSGTVVATTITGWSLDTWFLLRFATNSSSSANAYAVNGATPTTLGSAASYIAWATDRKLNYDFYIGASVGAVNNTNSPVADTAATGVEVDWLYFSNFYNDDITGTLSMEDDTRGTAVRTLDLFTDNAEVEQAEPAVVLNEPADLYPTTIVAPQVATGGGGGPVIKEFWS